MTELEHLQTGNGRNIDPSNDDFGAVLNCAVRYCMGRRTYMPHIVIDYITPLLPHLTDKTIWCFEHDVRERLPDGIGDEIDTRKWTDFYNAVLGEATRRATEL